MGRKANLVFLLLTATATSYAASPIICESQDKNGQVATIWPAPYLSNPSTLCFDVKGWPEFSGKNCSTNGNDLYWTGLVIVTEDGESQGRDSTEFRVLKPIINDEQIEYTIEWSRGQNWRPMQHVKINRLTGDAVSYFVRMHGGESYQCRLGKKAL